MCVRRGSTAKVEWNGARGRKRWPGDLCAAPTTLVTRADARCYECVASTALCCASSTGDGVKVSVESHPKAPIRDWFKIVFHVGSPQEYVCNIMLYYAVFSQKND